MCGISPVDKSKTFEKLCDKKEFLIDRSFTDREEKTCIFQMLYLYIHSKIQNSKRTDQSRSSQFSTAALSSSLESGAHSVANGIILRFVWVGLAWELQK